MEALFAELKQYVGFTAADEARLRAVRPAVQHAFGPAIDAFYARILEHADARAALERGERRVGQLKVTLDQWMLELFEGPWDTAYLERRARIGSVHVRIGLPQHYMVTAMHLVRRHLLEALGAAEHAEARLSVQRVCDLDLAIMLHTYRLDLEARQATAERLATYGQLVGSIGHELRNPLGVIETSLYVLKLRNDPDPRVVKHLDRIASQVGIANHIITQLLDLIRDKPLGRQPVSLEDVVTEVSAALTRPDGVRLLLPTPPLPRLSGDPIQLRQVLLNLVDNALHAAGPGGTVQVTVTRVGPQIELSIEDSGPGIDPAIKGRLFEPLVSARPRGIGLGLALVKRIVDRHGGVVEVGRSAALGGAQFVVRLPEAP
ncbi:MAG: histidine kinase [Myxococcaceae bacterium]|nr:histidine kinase [Myxococcaceae bacterium]